MTRDDKKYQWDSRDYAANSEVQLQWAMELVKKLGLRGNEHLLDIGCGDGKVTARLATELDRGEVLGIDSSPTMIELARDSHGRNTSNLNFRQTDARALPFTEEFDVIFSNAALHWIRDHRPVVQGMFNALKPGGRVLVQMGGRGNAGAVVQAMERVISRSPWQKYFEDFIFPYGFHGPEEYTQWLEEAGFAVRYIRLVPKEMVHADRRKFTGWLRTTWLPYLELVPKQNQAEFIEEVVTTYLGNSDPQEPVHTEMVRLEYLAVRPE